MSQSLAERLLELESSEEEEIRICSVDLETGCVHRLQQATQLTEALVEILPGGRRALLCGDFEERQQARCLLELLPKAKKRPSIIFESSLCLSLHIFARIRLKRSILISRSMAFSSTFMDFGLRLARVRVGRRATWPPYRWSCRSRSPTCWCPAPPYRRCVRSRRTSRVKRVGPRGEVVKRYLKS